MEQARIVKSHYDSTEWDAVSDSNIKGILKLNFVFCWSPISLQVEWKNPHTKNLRQLPLQDYTNVT